MTSSLKGVTSTNDDPRSCAICNCTFRRGLCASFSKINLCCGKQICLGCRDSECDIETLSRGAIRCSLCKRTLKNNTLGMLKKHAKSGQPWAQFLLAMCYHDGRQKSAQPNFEMVRWFRKAAGRNHPEATFHLGKCYLFGNDGCSRNLSGARSYFEKTMLLDPNLTDEAQNQLLVVGKEYTAAHYKEKYADGGINSVEAKEASADSKAKRDAEEARSVLTPLAKVGMTEAQYSLGSLLCDTGDRRNAERLFVEAALRGHMNAAFSAFACCANRRKPAQARYWLAIGTKRDDGTAIISKDTVNDSWRGFRDLRDHCGGCGKALDGKMRKICKQCKTYCYCDRECQKLHWNDGNGHRDDCMEVASLKEKTKEMRAANKSS